ncbi:MAG TPA: VIT domain-containing protein [Planctomycetaceae bacterium]|nr:VIT domain-containing protein [Planctomycetaceae bacterium]
MFHRQAFENSRPDGFPVLEIANDRTEDGQPRLFVPLKNSELTGQVAGPLASLRLKQTFGYRAEDCSKVVEALYRFPLPGDAAVRSVTVRFGDVTIQTELKERQQADATYERAKAEGLQAVLATRESLDAFTLKIAGLRPDQDVMIETFYVQLARSEGAGWSLRTPVTTPPRYVRADESGSRHAQGQPLAVLRDPGHRFAIELKILQCGSVDSPTHKLDVAREGEGCRVRLRDGAVLPDRDCILRWRSAQPQDNPGLTVLLEDAPGTKHIYFLAMLTPPATFDRGRGVSREAIVLVDHSGSMQGAKWRAADWAVERFLGELKAQDSFALGLFHNTTRWFADRPHAGSEDAVQQAVQFLKEGTDSGGTELGMALEQALSLKRSDGEAARHVLVITDAQVSDLGRIARLADQESKRPDRRRVSVLCIDASPNSLVATELAERGGGVARFLTSEPAQDDITTALDEVLADWSEPIVSGLKLEVNRANVEATGRQSSSSSEAGWSAIDLGDLPAGRPIWCVGRFPRGGTGDIVFSTTAGKGHKLATCSQKPQSPMESPPMVRPLFGARRILGLEQLLHAHHSEQDLPERLQFLGYDPQSLLAKAATVYAENSPGQLQKALKALLVEESLLYGLASAGTAFVAFRNEPGKPVESTVAVANALPAGWDEGFAEGGMRFMSLAAMDLACCRGLVESTGYQPDIALHCFETRRTMNAVGAANFLSPEMTQRIPSAPPEAVLLFEGVPQFANGGAILFDSTNAAVELDSPAVFSALQIEFPAGSPDLKTVGREMCLLFYVDDLSVPRARVRVIDILRSARTRPLNIHWQPGQAVRLELTDPAGAWRDAAPNVRVSLGVEMP